jgi:hypothetical protein
MDLDNLDINQILNKVKKNEAFRRNHKIEGLLLEEETLTDLLKRDSDKVYTYALDESLLNKVISKIEIKTYQWYKLVSSQNFSEEFVENHESNIHYSWLSMNFFKDKDLDFFKRKEMKLIGCWTSFSMNPFISLDILEYFSEKLNWHFVSTREDLTAEFIVKFKDKLEWEYLNYSFDFDKLISFLKESGYDDDKIDEEYGELIGKTVESKEVKTTKRKHTKEGKEWLKEYKLLELKSKKTIFTTVTGDESKYDKIIRNQKIDNLLDLDGD